MACAGQDFRFPLKADIFYAHQSQNSLGEVEKIWVLGRTGLPCELRVDKFNSDSSFAIDTKEAFFDMPMIVFGRFMDDIRINGASAHAISNILVTNVRDFCTDTVVFYESAKGLPSSSTATAFEIKTFQPFTNPWGVQEYYKTQLYRMEDQSEIFQ